MSKTIKWLLCLFIIFAISCAPYVRPSKNYTPTERIEMLVYYAGSDLVSEMLELPDSVHSFIYNYFWEENDPTPLTAENEYRDSYEEWIEWCDITFDGCVGDGWRSDMSMCIMLLGFPYYVTYETVPYYNDKNLQVWYYAKYGKLYFEEEYPDCWWLLNPPEEIRTF